MIHFKTVPPPVGTDISELNSDGTVREFYQVERLPYLLDRHPSESPIAQTVDDSLGSSKLTFSLGLRGAGKSWESHYRWLERYETERLIIRQTKDDLPWHLYGRPGVDRMILWLPERLQAKAYALERDQEYGKGAPELPLRVEHYEDVDSSVVAVAVVADSELKLPS